MDGKTILRTAGLVLLLTGGAAAIGALIVRDQLARHRRDLFSAHPLQRLAALGYLSGRESTVESVQLLRDFVAWEPHPLIRRRGAHVLRRMEDRLRSAPSPSARREAGA